MGHFDVKLRLIKTCSVYCAAYVAFAGNIFCFGNGHDFLGVYGDGYKAAGGRGWVMD